MIDPFASATAMLDALRRRVVSSVELLDLHLRRIERYNPALNALVIPSFDEARAAAQAADEARARGEDGALLGLPVTLKDSINVRGLRTTMGMPPFASFVPTVDGPIAARVRAAGAVIVGKTNVPPMLSDFQSANPIFGRTNNPWDPERTPGGSSGGGAAAIAAGLSPLEYGSDFAGSLRIPAAFSGVYAHRPSDTALPRSGQGPAPPLPQPAIALGVQGPLARSARDLELAVDVAAGPDAGEDIGWKLTIPPARHQRLRDFRVAVFPLASWLPVDGAVRRALDSVVGALRREGARVETACPEPLTDLRRHQTLFCEMVFAMMNVRLPEEARRARAAMFREKGDEFALASARGVDAGSGDFLVLHTQREQMRAAYRAFFREWDVLLAPSAIVPAFSHGPMPFPPLVAMLRHVLDVGGEKIDHFLLSAYPALASFAGQPATAFPVCPAPLPVGLQAIGPYLEDRTPIRFAELLAGVIGGFQAPPAFTDG
jgi:amidase